MVTFIWILAYYESSRLIRVIGSRHDAWTVKSQGITPPRSLVVPEQPERT